MRLLPSAAELALRLSAAVVMRMWQGSAWRTSEAVRPLTSLQAGRPVGGGGGAGSAAPGGTFLPEDITASRRVAARQQ